MDTKEVRERRREVTITIPIKRGLKAIPSANVVQASLGLQLLSRLKGD